MKICVYNLLSAIQAKKQERTKFANKKKRKAEAKNKKGKSLSVG